MDTNQIRKKSLAELMADVRREHVERPDFFRSRAQTQKQYDKYLSVFDGVLRAPYSHETDSFSEPVDQSQSYSTGESSSLGSSSIDDTFVHSSESPTQTRDTRVIHPSDVSETRSTRPTREQRTQGPKNKYFNYTGTDTQDNKPWFFNGRYVELTPRGKGFGTFLGASLLAAASIVGINQYCGSQNSQQVQQKEQNVVTQNVPITYNPDIIVEAADPILSDSYKVGATTSSTVNSSADKPTTGISHFTYNTIEDLSRALEKSSDFTTVVNGHHTEMYEPSSIFDPSNKLYGSFSTEQKNKFASERIIESLQTNQITTPANYVVNNQNVFSPEIRESLSKNQRAEALYILGKSKEKY